MVGGEVPPRNPLTVGVCEVPGSSNHMPILAQGGWGVPENFFYHLLSLVLRLMTSAAPSKRKKAGDDVPRTPRPPDLPPRQGSA